MKVVSVYPMKNFNMILEFEDGTYRLFDIRTIPANPKSLIADIQYDRDLFMTAAIDSTAGTVRWANEVDFDPQMLYDQSINIENLTNIRDFTKTELDTPVTEAIIALKEDVRASKELIDNYEYFIKHDIDNEEKKDYERQIEKLKKEIPSFAQAIDILETHQKTEDKKKMKEKLLGYYRTGTLEELHKILPFPQNFYWKFAEVVEMFEFGRISNELLSRGYSSDDLYNLFPVQDTDSMIKYYQKYGSIEIEQIFEALAEIYKEKDRIGTIKRLGNSPALLKEMSSIINSIFPEVKNEQEKINISGLADTETKNNNTLGSYTDEVLSVIKRVLSGKNSEDISNELNLSLESIEDTIKVLVEGTTLDELKEQYAVYKKQIKD